MHAYPLPAPRRAALFSFDGRLSWSLAQAQALAALMLALALALCLASMPVRAQDDPPGRVGRVAEVQGSVSWFDHEQGLWQGASRNLPVTSGDRISTGPQARAELRVGSTSLRLDAQTELEVLRLDDNGLVFKLYSGSLALRLRSREVAAELEVLTPEARLRPLRAGHFRIDRIDDTSYAGAWRGELRVDDEFGFTVAAGQRAELWREGPQRALRQKLAAMPADAFAERVQLEDQRDERTAANRYVSPEMTGAEDLDRFGRWDSHPEFGAVWFPVEVRAGWAPYRHGRWAWVRPWGWTWVDEAPWGFAPFHYGRWALWRERWCWVPGVYVVRPVFAPALVAWAGAPRVGVTVTVGQPPSHWAPLAPRQAYDPWYRHTPQYRGRMNEPPPHGRIDAPQERRWDGHGDRHGDSRRDPRAEAPRETRPDTRWERWQGREVRPDARLEPRRDSTPQTQPGLRPEPRPEGRPDSRPDPRPDVRAETRQPEPRLERHPEPFGDGPGMSRRDRREAALPQPAPTSMPSPATPAAPAAPAPLMRAPATAVSRPVPPLVQAPVAGTAPAAAKPADVVREEERRHIPNPQRRNRGELGANESQR